MQLTLVSGVSGLRQERGAEGARGRGLLLRGQPAAQTSSAGWSSYVASRGEPRVAMSADARSRRHDSGSCPTIVEEERANGTDVRLVFLDASDESLVRRFSETRRPHPLAGEGRTLEEAIATERSLLACDRRDGPSHRHELAHPRAAARLDPRSPRHRPLAAGAVPGVLRLQGRRAARRGFRLRLALPAQPALRPAAAAADRAGIPRWSPSSSARPRPGSCSRTSTASSSAGCRASRSTAAPPSRWRSAAPAGATARCTSWRASPSACASDHPLIVRHRDLERD